MPAFLLDRRALAIPLATLGALLVGAAAAAQPTATLGLMVAGGLVLLVLRAPAVALTLLLILTCVVPYGVQNRLGLGGGSTSPGLLLSDVLLITGVAAAILRLATRPVDRRTWRFGLPLLLVLVVVAAEFVAGVRAGHDVSRAGQDLRVLVGFGTFFIVVLIAGEERGRQQLLAGLVTVALLLGAWGMLQWFGHLSFGTAGDVGVRPGVRLTAAGSGQLQGGEYGFPVAIVTCFAVLCSGAPLKARIRGLLVAAIALNSVACLLTFERTFWFSAFLGVGFVILRSSRRQRIRMLVAAPFVAAAAVAVLAVAAPAQLATADQRLLSVSGYGSDAAVQYRVMESRFVLAEIRSRPLTGSGLAATIFWGRPADQVPAKSYSFSHNGYLWLAWRLGIPAAGLLILLFAVSVVLRPPPGDDAAWGGVRRGAQGAVLALLFASMTFPTFAILSITPAMGVLLALAVVPMPRAAELYEERGRDARAARRFAT